MQALINGPIVGIIMRDACRRAMFHARARCFEVEAEVKGVKAGGRTDWVTAADRECQEKVVKILRECFPDFGIIGEEDDLNVPCTLPGEDVHFTVDPIDGTSAYTRHQSHGWGCMIALVRNGVVIAVCIGDANSGELYYYRPGSENTHRLVRRGEHIRDVPLAIDKTRHLDTQPILLRDLPEHHNDLAQLLIRTGPFKKENGATKVLTADGSIGLSMARMWKGEVGGCVLKGAKKTPWDDTPVIGMSLRLGFTFLEIIPSLEHLGTLAVHIPAPPMFEQPREHQLIVVHSSRVPQLVTWAEAHGVAFRKGPQAP